MRRGEVLGMWKAEFPASNRYYEEEDGILYCGDNVEVLKQFKEESIDLVVTSPPYFLQRWYSAKSEEEFLSMWSFDKFKVFAKELYRVMKQGGVVVWVMGDQTIDGSEVGEPYKQVLYFKEECGFKIWDTMIYKKAGIRYPDKDRYYQIFEFMFVISKGVPKTVHLIQDRINKYVGKKVRDSKRLVNGDVTITKLDKTTDYFGVRHNIWEYKAGYGMGSTDKEAFKHPAVFPEALAKDHIYSWSNEGDIVLDPFSGSGTTLKMSKIMNRGWVGIDIGKEYCDIAIERVKKAENIKKTMLFKV